MKIGVSGASGHLGRAVVSELLERADGHEIVAISRTPETINAPPRAGLETTTGRKVLRGPTRISIVCSSFRASMPVSAGRRTSLRSTRP